MRNDRRRQPDITYATNNELGFDYLRDNMKFRRPITCSARSTSPSSTTRLNPHRQSAHAADHLRSRPRTTRVCIKKHSVVKHQTRAVLTMEEKNRSVALTEEGTRLEELMGIENLYDHQHIDRLHHIYQSLKAIHLFKKDVDYMVRDGRSSSHDDPPAVPWKAAWSDGLHQAVEAKEGVAIKSKNQTLASITFQNYFRMYSAIRHDGYGGYGSG